jgi:anionic cell wall polymer biosynthesis LytR-Cps2A-Psr (LCP) family protein
VRSDSIGPHRGPAIGLLAAVLALTGLLLGTAAPTVAFAPSSVPVEVGLPKALDVMDDIVDDGTRRRRDSRPRPGLPIDLGRDGRLTMLLIGSDWREASGGERTDVMMVATIDPTTGVAAVASIPRDMERIPKANGGTSGTTRVNSIYFLDYRDPKLPHARVDATALTRLTRDIAAFLRTEIDYWAFIRFGDFAGLINKLDGIRVDIEEEVLDSSYHHGASRGIWFPAQENYRLKGDPKCKPKPRKCRSALVYARSRKGTMGNRANSDYTRAERQQQIVLEGVKRAVDHFGSGIALLGLLHGVRGHVDTNIPMTPEAAAQLFAILKDVRLPRANMKVFAPGTWASSAPAYAIRPNVAAIRDWVDKTFYRVGDRGRSERRRD